MATVKDNIVERSNRTFMELKWNTTEVSSRLVAVLIVPLWNWNLRVHEIHCVDSSSNRTFMELKLYSALRKAISSLF